MLMPLWLRKARSRINRDRCFKSDLTEEDETMSEIRDNLEIVRRRIEESAKEGKRCVRGNAYCGKQDKTCSHA